MAPTDRDPVAGHFSCTDRERVAFEAGIKLGALYHQFVGVPLSWENKEVLEKCMERSLMVQPFTTDAKVRIGDRALSIKKGVYDYCNLSGEMLKVELTIEYGEARALCKLEMDRELNYPLMSMRLEEG